MPVASEFSPQLVRIDLQVATQQRDGFGHLLLV